MSLLLFFFKFNGAVIRGQMTLSITSKEFIKIAKYRDIRKYYFFFKKKRKIFYDLGST